MKAAGLVLGLLLFTGTLAVPAPDGLEPAGWKVAALFVWMVVWWLTEAAPMPVTAMLPVLALPLLGVAPTDEVVRSYATPLIVLVFGGALIALAAAKTGLHRRLARLAVRAGGGGARSLVLAMMAASGFLAMWMAPSISVVFMMEIALLVIVAATVSIEDEAERRRFACAVIVGVAYGAAFGGFTTLIGNPVNAAGAAMLKRLTGAEVGFAEWMTYGVPVAAIGLVVAWAVLVFLAFPVRGRLPDRQVLLDAVGGEGPISRAEGRMLAVAIGTVVVLVAQPLIRPLVPSISDAAVALAGGLLLFLIPSGAAKGERLLDWDDAKRIPWGVLMLIGGAVAISAALSDTGLAAWIAAPLTGLAGAPVWAAMLGLAVGIALLTELVNNFAAMAIGVAAANVLASALGADPAPLAIAATMAAAAGFIIPGPPFLALAAATPPVRLADLARSGLWLLVLAPMIYAGVCLLVASL